MRKWLVTMTFSGTVEAETAMMALTELKRCLGVLPEDARPEVRVTACSTALVDAPTDPIDPE